MTTKTLTQALAECGVTLTPDFSISKQREGSQYLFLRCVEIDGKRLELAHFGDFKTGKSDSWIGGRELFTASDQGKVDKFLESDSKANQEMKREVWEENAKEAERFLLEECTDRGSHAYLTRKQIPKLYGASIHPNEHGGVLIVPMRDVNGKLWNYQRIYSEKLSKGDKFFLPGARIEGTFFTFGEITSETKRIFVAEGFATAASIYLSFDERESVVAAFNAGNLDASASSLHKKFPTAQLIFAADNDAFTVIDGKPVNVGLLKARGAAGNYQGEVVFPRFPPRLTASKLTDFNDLHVSMGLSEVKAQIENPEAYKVDGEIVPLITKGKPTETALADAVLKEFKEKLIRQENDLFVYTGTHWEIFETVGIVRMKNLLNSFASDKLSSREQDGAYKMLMNRTPFVPRGIDLFTPNPWIANFANGSLHVLRNSDGSLRHEFHPHKATDYLTACLPFDFSPDSREVNTEFMAMLGRVFGDKTDTEAAIAHYAEILGSCILSCFTNISIFFGPPGTGKSTLLKIAARLVGERNLCGVDPTQFGDFNLESMPGKLVNIVTDLNTHKPISDELVKQIYDRMKFRVRRKNLKDIYAFMPAVHLWACNTLPKSFEGTTKSMGRRVTLVEITAFQPVGLYNKEYDQWVWEQGSQGIINFAVNGALRLIANGGHYTKPASSAKHMEGWQLESDPIGRFLVCLREEGIVLNNNDRVIVDPEGKIERGRLWETYGQWHNAEYNFTPKSGRTKFFQRIASEKFEVYPSKGVWYFRGIGSRIEAGSAV